VLGMKKYSRDYIDACRARVEADLRAYRKQVGKAPNELREADFVRLHKALFAEIEKKCL
jgi:hypothetical protein